MMGDVQENGVVRFSLLARQLADEARRLGLAVPGFRSPPRLAGANRTIRRSRAGATVAVRRQGRAPEAVASDLIDGILAANGLTGPEAESCRTHLHAALVASQSAAA
jgi:hypothetical protein